MDSVDLPAAPASSYISAQDAVLVEGGLVAAVGRISDAGTGGAELWLRPAWNNPRLHRIAGGSVSLQVTESPKFAVDQLVRVVGEWTHGAIAVRSVDACDLSVPQRVVPAADGAADAVDLLEPEGAAAVLEEASAHADGLTLASGGGRYCPLRLQVLHVSTGLATWHREHGSQFVEIISSVGPV